MTFEIRCKCGRKAQAKSTMIGKQLECPSCQAPLKIPKPSPDPRIPVHCACGKSFLAPAYMEREFASCPSCIQPIEIPARPARVDPLEDLTRSSVSPSKRIKRKELDLNMPFIIGSIVGVGAVVLLGLMIASFFSSDEPTNVAITNRSSSQSDSSLTTPSIGGRSAESVDAYDSSISSRGNDASTAASDGFQKQRQTLDRFEQSRPKTPPAPLAKQSFANVSSSSGNDTIPVGGFDSSENRSLNPVIGADMGGVFKEWCEHSGDELAGARSTDDDDHVIESHSWMSALLPYIGYQKLYDKIDFGKSWSSRDNIQYTSRRIAEFQNPLDDRKRWEGFPFDGIALTHFTGISGIEDGRQDVAAKYDRKDKRAGVFGYDRILNSSEIGDGCSNTLAIIGSGELASPWAMGGGGTIRGVRRNRRSKYDYFDSLTGFGSNGHSKRGAIASRADGSATFISADIDPDVFRALCTANGAEEIDETKVEHWLDDAPEAPTASLKRDRAAVSAVSAKQDDDKDKRGDR